MITLFFNFGFQNPITPIMETIIALHAHIMFYLVIITFFVLSVMFSIVNEFYLVSNQKKAYSSYRVEQLQTSRVVHSTSLEVIWTLIPVYILCLISGPSFALLYFMEEKTDPALTLKVVGHQWYWSYEYAVGDYLLDSYDSYMKADDDLIKGDFRLLEVDRTVVLPVNVPVRILVTSADVIHSWALPSAGVKMDAVPGRLNQVNFYATRLGTFYGQCSELCGVNHGFMPISVKVVTIDKFKQWLDLVN